MNSREQGASKSGSPVAHVEGTVRSRDVTLFYRLFGPERPGIPILILHGSTYYDSADWIDVAAGLASDREVVAFDARGFGRSSRSPTADYSNDAQLADIIALLDQLSWPRAVFAGHSRGGAFATLAAARMPERTAGLVLIDHCPGIGVRGRGAPPIVTQTVGQKPPRYPTLEAAVAATSRSPKATGQEARARLLAIFARDGDEYLLTARDPDHQNPIPLAPTGWKATIPSDVDLWQELAKVHVPFLVLRALDSPAFTDDALARIRREFPAAEIIDIVSGHDMAAEAPDMIVAEVTRYCSHLAKLSP